jgi:hypothetical protein
MNRTYYSHLTYTYWHTKPRYAEEDIVCHSNVTVPPHVDSNRWMPKGINACHPPRISPLLIFNGRDFAGGHECPSASDRGWRNAVAVFLTAPQHFQAIVVSWVIDAFKEAGFPDSPNTMFLAAVESFLNACITVKYPPKFIPSLPVAIVCRCYVATEKQMLPIQGDRPYRK